MATRLDNKLIGKAVQSLFDFDKKSQNGKEKASLFQNSATPIFAQIQLAKESKSVQKPVRVKIPHSLFNVDDEGHSICLFCRSEDKETLETYLKVHPIKGLDKVVSINNVKKYYDQFKDRKQLQKEHSHFLCDARIARQLYNLLGRVFSDKNSLPVQIDCDKLDELEANVIKAVNSVYMHLSGRNITIRFGHTGLTSNQVVENILQGLPFAVAKFQNEWKDVHSVHLKLAQSGALPIYSKNPDDMSKFIASKTNETEKTTATPAKASSSSNGKKTDDKKKKSNEKSTEVVKTPAKESKKVKADKELTSSTSKKTKKSSN